MSNRLIAKDPTGSEAGGEGLLHLQVPRGDNVSVRDFMLFIWRHRWLAAICGVVCGLLAAGAAWVITPEYTATVVLLPVSSRGESLGLGSVGSAVSQLSGLASIAGVSLAGGDQEKAEALATLQSEVLTDQYIQQHDLLPILFSKQWNADTGQWTTRDPKKVPTLWKANQLFKGKVRTVVDDTKTGLVTLTIRWKNPYLAAQWANGLVKMTNDYLRQRAIDESDRNIAYLNQQISKTNIVEVDNAIYALMEAEIKKEMVARGREEFALRVIDPAVAPERKAFPQPTLWTVGGVLAGAFLGLLVAVLRETFTDETERLRLQREPPVGGGLPHCRRRVISGLREPLSRAHPESGVSIPDDYVRDQSGLRCSMGGRSAAGRSVGNSAGMVTVVTVAFNAARTIERTINSVAAQSYANLEYIVVDGGSADGTIEVLRQREADIDLWLSEPDRGISDAFNKGIALARGEFIALVNADDWLEPQHMEWAVERLRHADDGFVFGNLMVHGADGLPQYVLIGDRRYAERIRHAMPDINHPSVVCRRGVYEQVGLYDTQLRVAMDYEWLLRAHIAGIRGGYVPQITSHMEGSGISHRSGETGLREVRDVSMRYGYPRKLAHFRFAGRLLRLTARTYVERWISRELAHRLRVLIHPGFHKMNADASVRGTNGAT